MHCIICLEDIKAGDFSEEHVFPDAIGGTLIINSVCRVCNGKMGHSVDSHLTNHYLIQAQRLILKIKGKSGRVPNPLEKNRLADDPEQKVQYVFDEEGEPKEVYSVPLIKREKGADGTEIVSIRIDAKDEARLPEIVNKIRTRKGLPPLPDEDIKASSESPPA